MPKNRKAWPRTAVMLCLICALMGSSALAAESLVPMGTAVGIQMNTDGVLVVDTTEIEDNGGVCVSPAKDAGIRPGDVITALDGQETKTAAELAAKAAELSDVPVDVAVERDGRALHFDVCPVSDESGPKLGLWLRDGIAGVGTLTFYDPDSGMFGALGHGVADEQTATILPMSGGCISSAQIVDVKSGLAGEPGALSGVFDMQSPLGIIDANTECGIFGHAVTDIPAAAEAIPAAEDSEISAGPAYILASVTCDGVERYDVEISRGGSCAQGTMLNVRVTDPQLLELTGGIVQGMSGSPIIQNGKLVGAVTHVLVSDPKRGYGVSIQSMLSAARDNMLAA